MNDWENHDEEIVIFWTNVWEPYGLRVGEWVISSKQCFNQAT